MRSFIFAIFISIVAASSALAQTSGSVGGSVVDSLGSVVVGATVTAVAANGNQKQSISNARGEFAITGLAPGTYTVKAIAPKFALYENTEVVVAAGERNELTVLLTISGVEENVDVSVDNQVSTDSDANASATVLKGADLDALPDDPDELEAALQALAGASAGPDGGQINIDGFTGGRMPPKEAIREIRINQNPFSAEYERIGFGRIDILTRPGFDKFRGSANFNFNDEALNSRNPFAANRASSQVRRYGGFISGPIQSKKSAYFIDIHRSESDENSVVSAFILDPSLNIVEFNQDITVPTRRFSISPRIDYAINENHTLVGRYSYNQNTSENQGIGGFTLPSRATNRTNSQHSFNITESAIIDAKTVNETRFQYEYNNSETLGDNSTPAINVSNAFSGGGAQIGQNFNKSRRWELQQYTTTAVGKASQHALKFGIRVRGISLDDRSESGYGGSFTFSGFGITAPEPCDVNQDLIISSIEQYRCNVQGNTDPRFNPTQFSITTGNPLASVSRVDYSPFIPDDWKVRTDLTLSFGLRYENQTNIDDNFNFAPRFGFAWAPGAGGARAPKTVIRGGLGIFYDRFNENFTLRSIRNDGFSQVQFLVTNNSGNLLDQAIFRADGGVSNVPTAAQVATGVPLASVPFRVDESINSPYSTQWALSLERQLPFRTTFTATFTSSRSVNILRTRNINAPVCPNTIVCPPRNGLGQLTAAQVQALRPNPAAGNITYLESSGYSSAQFLRLNFRTSFGTRFSLTGGYNLGFAKGDTDSLSSAGFTVNAIGYPAYSYDTSSEFAPSAFNPRHSVFIVGSFSMPWGVRANSIINITSGRPFNITSGSDNNYDSLFFERPTFAAVRNRCDELGLTDSFCDVSGVTSPDTTIIPRNYGKGPGSFTVNLNLSKTFGFGGGPTPVAANDSAGRGGNRGGGGGGRPGGGGGGPQMVMVGGGGGGMFGGQGGERPKPYNLNIGINVQNLFNHVNFSSPVGSLTSPSFGRSRSTGGGFGGFGGGGGSANRRVELSARFSW